MANRPILIEQEKNRGTARFGNARLCHHTRQSAAGFRGHGVTGREQRADGRERIAAALFEDPRDDVGLEIRNQLNGVRVAAIGTVAPMLKQMSTN
jgi:hypothetical protein